MESEFFQEKELLAECEGFDAREDVRCIIRENERFEAEESCLFEERLFQKFSNSRRLFVNFVYRQRNIEKLRSEFLAIFVDLSLFSLSGLIHRERDVFSSEKHQD